MPRFNATIIMLLLCLVTRVQRCSSFSTTSIPSLHRRQVARTTTSISSSRRTYLDSLNEAQVEAVTQPLEGITRVVAGPGAGKTRVLTCRIAHLLNDDDRDRILAVTFTKKASGEMQERLKGLLDTQHQQGQDPGDEILISDNGLVEESSIALSSGLERVTLGTFHSICAKILRWNGKQLASLPSVYRDMVGSRNSTNLDASFAILDQGDQLRIVKEKLKLVGIDLQREKDLKAQQILNNLGKIKSKVKLDPKELRKNRALAVANDIYPLYREHLFASNALDFDDLIYMTRELLQANETVRDSLRRRWPHVLVDEFQDTSEVQLDLVKLWTSESLLVVGDADQ
jgi:DNA helicase-2/ATP-dependent DNA helicase PcrA